MKRSKLLMTIVATLGVHHGVASACSLGNPIVEMPNPLVALHGSSPLLFGTAEAELLDPDAKPIALAVVADELTFEHGTKARAWRPAAPLSVGQYTWRSHLSANAASTVDVDPVRDKAVSLTDVTARVAFRNWGVPQCESLGPLDALELEVTGSNIEYVLVELRDEAETRRLTVLAWAEPSRLPGDQDIVGVDASRSNVSLLLRQSPLVWSEPTLCAKVSAVNALAPLSAPIDIGCYSTIASSEPTPDGSELTAERADVPPGGDDEGCNGGAASPLALLGLLALWRRS